MAAESSVGQIGLDLVVNKNGFNKQMGSIQKLASKAGKALAAAFAVKKLVDFGAKCIELGSDLQEVQNVVDVTFPAMTKQVNDFAQGAAASFGLSETMAKKFTGTFGAMSKAFGFSESAAYDMSTTLTGLAGDVASFYNLSQDEAYTKLKSVFTGETESLKDLGVVMTQTALDSFALANGFGKTTAQMTEQEKVALRYQFVMKQLSGASGDFLRTSDGWANQVRVLKLQFDSFKASVGQGLINVLTPVIKTINNLMAKLVQLGNAFKNLTASIMGKKAATVASGMVDAETAASGISDNLDEAGKSAKKLKSLLPTDELNALSKDDSATAGTEASPSLDMADIQATADAVDTTADRIADKFSNLFKNLGFDNVASEFNNGINKINFDSIKTNFSRIVNQIPSMAETMAENIQTTMKPLAGLIGNEIGNSVAIASKTVDTGLDGIAAYLERNTDRINEWSKDVAGSIANGFTNLTDYNETISNALLGALEEAKPAISAGITDFLTGFTDFGMAIGTIVSDSFEIFTGEISQWVSDNAGLIEDTISEFLQFAGDVTSLVGQIVGDIGQSMTSWWESKGSTTFKGIVDAWNSIKETVLELWNEILMPILENAFKEIQKLWNDSLKPLWDNILSLVSSVGDFITMLWNQIIKPVVDYLVETLGPTVKNIVNIIVSVVGTMFAYVSDVFSGIIKALGGVLDFLTGVFTGDWEKAWNGIKDFVTGIWDAIWGSIKAVINLIIDGINTMIELVYSALRLLINGIGDTVGKIGDILGKDWGFSIPNDPPKIPKLANGGYVRANTPQLAMIGDNRHEGEVVSPESKLQEIANSAVMAALKANENVSSKQLDKIIALLNLLIDVISEGHSIEIDGQEFGKILKKLNLEYYKATGRYLLEG